MERTAGKIMFALFAVMLSIGSVFADSVNGSTVITLNSPPVITGVGGPTSLNAGETGTWSISAYDPDGNYLSYSVNWGDNIGQAQQGQTDSGSTGTFQHTYSSAGTYTITFTVKDSLGASTQSSITTTVGGSSGSSLQIVRVWQQDESFEPVHMLYAEIKDGNDVANLNNVKVTLQVTEPNGRTESYNIGYHTPGTAYSYNDYYGFGFSKGSQCGTYRYVITAQRNAGSSAAVVKEGSFYLGSSCSSTDNYALPTLGKISYWFGKVNQHTDSGGVWQTDPDGTSGANLDKITYCKKFYPGTTGIKETSVATLSGWRNAGNSGSYTSIKAVYNCVGTYVAPSNQAPVITGTAGPSSLAVGASGTWTVSAYDPDGTYLAYSVNWGDTGTSPSASDNLGRTGSTATFQHTYSNAGTYTITFTVSDDKGAQTQSTITVAVGGSSAKCTDSDGGDNVYVKGTTVDPRGVQGTDYCTGSTTLVEYVCDALGQTTGYKGGFCPSGYTCSDGACVQASSDCSGYSKLSVGGEMHVPPGASREYGIILQDISADSDRAAMIQVLDRNDAVLDVAKVAPGPMSHYVYSKTGWSSNSDENLRVAVCKTVASGTDGNSAYVQGELSGMVGTDLAGRGCSTIYPGYEIDRGAFKVRLKSVAMDYGISASQRYATVEILDQNENVLKTITMYPGLTYNYAKSGISDSVAVKLCDTAYGTAAGTAWAKFNVTLGGSGTANLPPVITGTAGPSSLAVGASGTWTVSAYDPDGKYLNYRVLWGDEGTKDTLGQDVVPYTDETTATFQHAYSKAGTYKIVFTVSDDKDAQTQSTITVKVGDIVTSKEVYASVGAIPTELYQYDSVYVTGKVTRGKCQSEVCTEDATKQKYVVVLAFDNGAAIAKAYSGTVSSQNTQVRVEEMTLAPGESREVSAYFTASKLGTNFATIAVYTSESGGYELVASDTAKVYVKESGIPSPPNESVTIVLEKGWNQVSVPVFSLQVSELADKCGISENVWYYNAATKQYEKATTLGGGHVGFWVRAYSECKYTINEPYLTPAPYAFNLKAGWNMIGAPLEATAISSFAGNCKITSGPWNYSPAAGQYGYSGELAPGKGYWVKVASDCTLGGSDMPPEAPQETAVATAASVDGASN